MLNIVWVNHQGQILYMFLRLVSLLMVAPHIAINCTWLFDQFLALEQKSIFLEEGMKLFSLLHIYACVSSIFFGKFNKRNWFNTMKL